MELEYSLEKEDFLNYAKQLQKNKKLMFAYFKYNKFLHLHLSMIVIIAYFFVNYYTNPSLFKFLSFSFFVIVLIELLIFFNSWYFSRFIKSYYRYIFGKGKLSKITLNAENINVYSDKYLFSFHKNQIIKVFDLEDYLSFIVDSDDVIRTIILPKRIFQEEEIKTEVLNLIENYKNKEDCKKIKILNSKYILPFVIIAIILFKAFTLFWTNTPNLGLTITSFPVVYSVKRDSAAEKLGFKSGDIIVKINGENQEHKHPYEIAKKLNTKSLKVKIIEAKEDFKNIEM